MGGRVLCLAGVEAGGDGGKKFLVRIGAGEEKADAPGIAHDNRAYLEELEPEGAAANNPDLRSA